MIKTAFTCNSLRIKHLFSLAGMMLSFKSRKNLNSYFLHEISRFFNIEKKSVFLYGSARMGLYSVLSEIKTSESDEVIVAGYTCVVVTNAVKYARMRAVYVDIDEKDLNINTNQLRSSITENTKAIILTHNFGISCNYIDQLKKEYPDITMIEDAAHTMGSVYDTGEKVGLKGDASFFSLEYSKPLTTGMGGILLVNNKQLQNKMSTSYEALGYYPHFVNFKILASLKLHLFSSSRNTAFLKRWLMGLLYITGLLYKSSKLELMGERPKHYPVKLSPMLSYIGYLQLKEIEIINFAKDEQSAKFNMSLKGIKGIRQYYSKNYNFARYPVLFENGVGRENIRLIIRDLKNTGIYPGEWFNDVVHPKGSFRYGYYEGSCKIGESVSGRMINFPVTVHRQVTTKDFKKIRAIFLRHLEE